MQYLVNKWYMLPSKHKDKVHFTAATYKCNDGTTY